MHQSMKNVLANYDFASGGTLKGGVMHLHRQTSMKTLKNRNSSKNSSPRPGYRPHLSSSPENGAVVGQANDTMLHVEEHQNLQRLSASKQQKAMKKKQRSISDDSGD